MKENGIRFRGRPLGRPPKETLKKLSNLNKRKTNTVEMLWTEFPLRENSAKGRMVTGLTISEPDFRTSEAWIKSIFLVMNLMILLRELYKKLFSLYENRFSLFLRILSVRIIANFQVFPNVPQLFMVCE